MNEESFADAVEKICIADPRYNFDAYFFVRDALDFTAKLLKRQNQDGPQRHLTGQELLEGIRQFAIQEFGPISFTVLQTWGIHKTEDFGEIVFNLVESGKLGSTDEDKREDFGNGYDFNTAFVKPFLPSNSSPTEVRH